MRVLITGNSHTISLRAGLFSLVEAGELPDDLEIYVVPLGNALPAAGKFFDRLDGQVVITHPKYRSRIARLSPTETPFDFIGFSSPFHSRPVWGKRAWSTFRLATQPREGVPLSKALVRRSIREHNAHMIEFLQALKSVGFETFAIEGPRPFRHNAAFAVTGIPTIQHIDQEYSRLTRESLASSDIPTVAMPPETYDADGFSRLDFRHENPKDGHHGNTAMGRIMMGEIIRFVQGKAG